MGLRSRNIKPGFFRNELLATLPMATRLLFTGLWCAADREGCFEYRPQRLRAEIFPYDGDLDIVAGIQELARLGFLRIYTSNSHNCPIAQIINFKKHQTPHHTEKQSILPACASFTVSSPLSHGGYPSDSLIPDSLIPDSTLPLPPPLKGGVVFELFLQKLKEDFATAHVFNRHFHGDMYDKYFRDIWLVEIKDGVAVLGSPHPSLLEEGLRKFPDRLRKTFLDVAGFEVRFQIGTPRLVDQSHTKGDGSPSRKPAQGNGAVA